MKCPPKAGIFNSASPPAKAGDPISRNGSMAAALKILAGAREPSSRFIVAMVFLQMGSGSKGGIAELKWVEIARTAAACAETHKPPSERPRKTLSDLGELYRGMARSRKA
jgi:hypothetical protein